MCCVYRWSDRRKDSPHDGAAIMVARVSEERLASGKATFAEVEKRVVCEMAAKEWGHIRKLDSR